MSFRTKSKHVQGNRSMNEDRYVKGEEWQPQNYREAGGMETAGYDTQALSLGQRPVVSPTNNPPRVETARREGTVSN